ncbi:hypothetical protein T265_05532 [Opisthorchis viverrini]|uniref:Reverse transcriptase domain-containing protein n=1 Tax=Opisthorchis viverrini TaxID=6198 RepID=A0A074ZNQ9_OPIVI|nr:hypothetical protein T265_05532 [Opisthorchis viverrini]KER27427.1 hypothetical protein T265_05532 [Opisthorchis viverrini]
MLPACSLTDIEYMGDVALLGSDPSKIHTILDNVNTFVTWFAMSFTAAKYKVLLKDWVGSRPKAATLTNVNLSHADNGDDDRVGSSPNLMLTEELTDVVGKFDYLGHFISSDGLAGNEITFQIGQARAAFANPQYVWRRLDASLSVKGRVYTIKNMDSARTGYTKDVSTQPSMSPKRWLNIVGTLDY